MGEAAHAVTLVDAHTHVVADDADRYPLESSVGADQGWHHDRPVDADAMVRAADAAGVDAVVFVQSLSCHGYDNRYVIESARRFGSRAVGVGAANPADPGAAARLRSDVVDGGMRGVRLSAAGDPPSFDTVSIRDIVAEAADLAVPVVLVGGTAQLARLERLAAAFPSVVFVVDHCGFVDLRDPDTFPAAGPLLALVDLPNIVCKVSSINLQAATDPAAVWCALAARFGSDRLLWGSDYPHSDGPGYSALVELARQTTADLGPTARDDVLGGTARRIWPGV